MATLMRRSAEFAAGTSVKTEVYSVSVCFTILAIAAVVFRFWARYRCTGFYGFDDWLIVLSLLFVLASFALNVVMIENGLGGQVANIPPESMKNITNAFFAEAIIYVVVLGMIKVAILVMYYRVFPIRPFKIGVWVLGVVTVVWSSTFTFMNMFQCTPISRAWNLEVTGQCLDVRTLIFSNAIPNICLDVAVLVLPVYQAWKLQMKKSQKVALTCIFLSGIFVLIASICRLAIFSTLNLRDLSAFLKTLAMWSHIEVSVALISACLPTMRPLLTAFLSLAGSRWSNDVEEDNVNIRDCAVSEAAKSRKWSNAGEWRLSVAYVDSDSSSVAEEGGVCKKIFLKLIQIPKLEVDLNSCENSHGDNENIC